MTQKNRTKTMIVSSILAAMIFVFTYLVRIPVPGGASGAYMNVGDSAIYSASMLVGAPWAAAAAGIGSMFVDIIMAGGIYIPATLVIKGLMGFVCAVIMKKSKLPQFIFACIIGGAIMVVGYGVFEWIAFGWTYAMGTIVYNLLQWIVGVVGATALYYPVKRIKGTL